MAFGKILKGLKYLTLDSWDIFIICIKTAVILIKIEGLLLGSTVFQRYQRLWG